MLGCGVDYRLCLMSLGRTQDFRSPGIRAGCLRPDPGRPDSRHGLGAVPSSKTALNIVTAMYAKELWDTPANVNAANPRGTALPT